MTSRFDRLKQILSCGSSSDISLVCNCDTDYIVRGTTKLQTFKFPFTKDTAKEISISYMQNGNLILKKNKSDLSFTDDLAYFVISEDETLRFANDEDVTLQTKATLLDDEIISSELITLQVKSVSDDSRMTSGDGTILAVEANVKDQDISVTTFTDLVTGNNIYKCVFNFDASWDNFDKEYIFKDEYNNEVTLVPNGDIIIPSKVLEKPGRIYIAVKGTKDSLVKQTELSNALDIDLSNV